MAQMKTGQQGRGQTVAAAVFCVLLMVFLGASDAFRGVFLSTFEETFSLTKTQSSLIIMMSYAGNLLFLFLGGYIVDRVSRKKFLAVVILLWMAALTVYVCTTNYTVLLIAMIFSMGASTMLSTTVNLITPLCFASAAFFINFLNFAQGAGISGAQNLGGQLAERFGITAWHGVNLFLLLGGLLCLGLLFFVKIPTPERTEGGGTSYLSVLKNPACPYLILICGCYYVAEHGLQNWMVTYGNEYLGFSISRSALFLSLFFGGIMLGRLVFAPLVQKWGIMKSMSIFTAIAGVLYIAGILLGKVGIVPLCLSGLAFSILWPTFVLMTGTYYTPETAGAGVGFVTGISTIFDIAFNAFFGTLVETAGFALSILILPAAMLLFCVGFFLLKRNVRLEETA